MQRSVSVMLNHEENEEALLLQKRKSAIENVHSLDNTTKRFKFEEQLKDPSATYALQFK